jgi:DNA-binding NarL/FixJ family response regulator
LAELGAAIHNLLERSQLIHKYHLSIEESSHLDDAEISNLALKLTQREQEVLVLVTHGLSNAEIGTRLHLSPRTVEKYVSSLFRKTETSNRAELVGFAMKHHLVE